MFEKHEFYGSVTVGERGQIVLPAKLREEYGIEAGDKLLVIGPNLHGKAGILIVKAEVLSELLTDVNRNLKRLMDRAAKKD